MSQSSIKVQPDSYIELNLISQGKPIIVKVEDLTNEIKQDTTDVTAIFSIKNSPVRDYVSHSIDINQ